jgi:hypothetical protein
MLLAFANRLCGLAVNRFMTRYSFRCSGRNEAVWYKSGCVQWKPFRTNGALRVEVIVYG